MAGKSRFRHDINALRAIAVAGVVLFHFGVPGFSGGFAGVDVFFVISGFLMTQIISESIRDKKFSFLEFILARAKRIIPALAVLIIVLLILGFFFLAPTYYEWLGRDAASSIVFFSNQLFAKKVDYFSPAGEHSWLLHTWSLAVEWQFYVLFPVLLIMAHRYLSDKATVRMLAFLLVISFIGNVVATHISQQQAFYSLSARIWMFLVGGIVYLHPAKQSCRMQAAGGILLIALSYFFLDGQFSYPGIWSLLPVLGAAIFVRARIDAKWMYNVAASLTGKFSYSLYLWHWPVFVFAEYVDLLQIRYVPVWIMLSFGFAWLSYNLMEEPFRLRKHASVKKGLLSYLIISMLIYGAASWVQQSEGFASRTPQHLVDAQKALDSVYTRQKECMTYSGCLLGGEAPEVLLWGDSHAAALAPAFDRAISDLGKSAKIRALSACAPLIGWDQDLKSAAFRGWSMEACRDFNRAVMDEIANSQAIKHVVLAASWINNYAGTSRIYAGMPPVLIEDSERQPVFVAQLEYTACTLAKFGKKVYLVTPVMPQPFSQPLHDLKRGFLGMDSKSAFVSLSEYEAASRAFNEGATRAHENCGAKIIDVSKSLCSSAKCEAKKGDVYLYRDQGHITVEASLLTVDSFKDALR